MKQIPIGNRVLIQLEKNPETLGGIYVQQEKDSGYTNIGTVFQLGTGKYDENDKLIPWKVKVGERVIVEKTPDLIMLKINNEIYHIFRQEEIIGVIK